MQVNQVTDLNSYLMQTATDSKSQSVQQSIGMSVMKEVLDQQKMAGESLVRMLQPDGAGGFIGGTVDVKA